MSEASAETGQETGHEAGHVDEAAAERRRLGGAFVTGGEAYERLRPSYPREVVAWLLEGAPDGPVADVGAGTGKLTRVLADLRPEVVAVEPSGDMLDRLRAALPQVTGRQGTGEDTGLADDSASAVLYGQAWHWVDPVAGSAEAARILRPGGVLGLLWNYMDLDDPRAAALNDAMHTLDGPGSDHDGSAADVVAPLVRDGVREVRWEWHTTTGVLADLVTTRSYYLARPEDERARLRDVVARTVAERFGPVGDTPAVLPHRTAAHRFVLR